jgi:dipeptidyl aminopeptidase/acylaminoacyl peptidase
MKRLVLLGPSSHHRLPILLLLFTTIACSLSTPSSSTPSPTPTAQGYATTLTAYAATQAADTLILPTFTQIPSFVPATPTVPAETINAKGPWLVYATDAGQTLVILNADGNGSLRVEISPLLDTNDLINGQSPLGGVIAFRTGLYSRPEEAALYLLYLPEGRLEKITSLVSHDVILAAEEDQDERALTAEAGVVQEGTIAWSPDGRYLAFIAALERNSSDLYLYDTVTKKFSRMTFGSHMTATPYWSPDSQWIIVQEVEGFTNRSEWIVDSVRKINAQTDLSYEVYVPPPNSYREIFLGWASSTDLISYSLGKTSGSSLRLVDLTLLKINLLLSTPFAELAIDPITKTMAFTRSNTGTESTTFQSGLYLITPNNLNPYQVQAGNIQELSWSKDGNEFLARGAQGLITISTDGEVNLLVNEAQVLPSPSTKWLAGWGDSNTSYAGGLRLYRSTGNISQQITGDPVQMVIWQPDSNGVFYISGNYLYLATLPNLQPVMMDANVHPGASPILVWVSPGNG